MNPPRLNLSLPAVTGVLAVVVGVLGWLLLVFAGDRSGRMPLPGVQGSTVEYMADQGRGLSLEQVERLAAEEWRTWGGEGYMSSGRWGESLWVRATLRNPEAEPLRGVLENDDFFADRAELWLRRTNAEDGANSAERSAEAQAKPLLSGESVPAKEKVLPGREVAWPVVVPARGEQVIILRFQNFTPSFVRLAWWPRETDFHLMRMRGGLAEGIYLGGMLALLGYTTLLWLRLRAADIGYYVCYLGAVGVFILLARAQAPAFGWPLGSPGLETALEATIMLNVIFLTQFARSFLELKTRLPKADRWVRLWLWLMAALLVAVLLTQWWLPAEWLRLTILAVGITHVGLLGLAIAAWRAGAVQARFFVLSFSCLFATTLPAVAVWFWHALLRDAALRWLMIGSALEMLLLALALADRFVRTQRALVEETEQRRMIEAAYADELAEEVRERTRELQDANADKDRMLAVIGHDLRSPLTGLMRSAEEATGDFARETARTGRALLLMIEDLVRWARLRAGAGLEATHQATGLVASAVALHHSLAEHGGVTLALEVPEGLRVETDLVLAQTLVRNLLANALKFAETRVVLRAADDGAGGVRFSVGNDGPPLSPAVAARLAAGKDEPLTATGGLGLRLCREICRAFGTRLEAGVGVDGGTEFAFILKKAA